MFAFPIRELCAIFDLNGIIYFILVVQVMCVRTKIVSRNKYSAIRIMLEMARINKDLTMCVRERQYVCVRLSIPFQLKNYIPGPRFTNNWKMCGKNFLKYSVSEMHQGKCKMSLWYKIARIIFFVWIFVVTVREIGPCLMCVCVWISLVCAFVFCGWNSISFCYFVDFISMRMYILPDIPLN